MTRATTGAGRRCAWPWRTRTLPDRPAADKILPAVLRSLIVPPLVASHPTPLGRQHRIRLRQPRVSESIADEPDVNAPGRGPLARAIEIPAHRLCDHRAQRDAAGTSAGAQRGNQRGLRSTWG